MTDADNANLWHAINGVGERIGVLAAEAAGVRAELRGLTEQVIRQNGRVTALEAAQHAHREAHAKADGKAEERAQAVLTKGQLAMLAAVMGLVGTVGGAIGAWIGFLR